MKIKSNTNKKLGIHQPIRFSPKKEDRSRKEGKMHRVGKYYEYTPLNISLIDLYKEICQAERLPQPRPQRAQANTNQSPYYEVHNNYGHKTNDYFDSCNVIEQLIRDGCLAWYIATQRSLTKC